jgi:hypothetical protein
MDSLGRPTIGRPYVTVYEFGLEDEEANATRAGVADGSLAELL